MTISISQSAQGLLAVSIDGKPSDWKISNQSGTGVWRLYKAGTAFMPLVQLEKNLAPFIHKPKELAGIVSEFIQTNNDEQKRKAETQGNLRPAIVSLLTRPSVTSKRERVNHV